MFRAIIMFKNKTSYGNFVDKIYFEDKEEEVLLADLGNCIRMRNDRFEIIATNSASFPIRGRRVDYIAVEKAYWDTLSDGRKDEIQFALYTMLPMKVMLFGEDGSIV